MASVVRRSRSQPAFPSGRSALRSARRRPRRSAEERTELLAGFADSGLSLTAYCRESGLSPATFCRWRRQQSTASPRRFAAVQLAGASSVPGATISVLCPSGHTVLVPPGTDPHWLGQLAAVLR